MAVTSHDIRAMLGYYQPKADGSPPDRDDLALILGRKDMDTREALINDIRGKEELYSLDNNGFEIIRHASNVVNFEDVEKIKSTYYAEMEELIRKRTGASKIIIFNHLVRSGPSPMVDSSSFLKGIPGPAPRVHIDQTPKGAEQALFRELPEEIATEISSHRWQILNAWRPLKTIQKDPLAIADASTFPASDLVPLPRMYGDKEGENCAIKADGFAQHRWHYLFEQQPDEVLLFKQHDSDTNAKARGAPHSAFQFPGTEHLENRRSIEIRAIVCY